MGLFESMDTLYCEPSSAAWSISAGAKTLFMLPKLNERSGFRRLRMAYDIDPNLQPRYLTDHWQLFQAMARHENFGQPWQNEILFFTKNWLFHPKMDIDWMKFKDYLIKNAWHQIQFAVSKVSVNLTWEHCSKVIATRNLKPIPYLVDHIKHILLIALGRWSGFKVADTNHQVAPIDGLQHAITEIYGLKNHIPTILHLSQTEQPINRPLYYSLSFPTLIEGLPQRINNTSTRMIDIRDIKQIIDVLIPTFEALRGTSASALEHRCFEYFHVESDPYGEILSSKQLPSLDEGLLALQKKPPYRSFCATSQFWRGCVRISEKKSD